MNLPQLNSRKMRFKIDTGADVTVIPYLLCSQRYDGMLRQVKTSLVGPSQNPLKVKGCFDAAIQKGDTESLETVYVFEKLQSPLVEDLQLST